MFRTVMKNKFWICAKIEGFFLGPCPIRPPNFVEIRSVVFA